MANAPDDEVGDAEKGAQEQADVDEPERPALVVLTHPQRDADPDHDGSGEGDHDRRDRGQLSIEVYVSDDLEVEVDQPDL